MGGSVVLEELVRRVQALQGLGLRLEGFRVSGSGPLTASHKTAPCQNGFGYRICVDGFGFKV